MLISVHLPKTAGSSFAASLKEHYGEALLLDYDDLPLHKKNISRNINTSKQFATNLIKNFDSVSAIHGHFLPFKYRSLQIKYNCTFITWIRDPAERIASQYYYMKRHYTKEKADKQPLLKRLIEEEWTLEDFCLAPELQNTYTKFFWQFPINKFDFIGVVDNYQEDLVYFSKKYLNTTLQEHKQNTNPALLKPTYFEDPSFKEFILKYHSKDNAIYQSALIQSNARLRYI